MDWLAPVGDTLTVTEGREDQDGTTRNWSATTYRDLRQRLSGVTGGHDRHRERPARLQTQPPS